MSDDRLVHSRESGSRPTVCEGTFDCPCFGCFHVYTDVAKLARRRRKTVAQILDEARQLEEFSERHRETLVSALRATAASSGHVSVTALARSWDKPFCPACAGRRAVQRHGEALRRLADA